MEDIEEMLTCAICLDFYNSPRKLPCHHVYCVECLRGLVDQFTAILHCPECRAKHIVPNVDRIPVDYRIIKFVEIQKNLTTLTLSEADVKEAAGSEAAGTSEKEQGIVEEEALMKLESMIMRELRELFTLIDEQETKDTMLTQKELLLKKKAVISITRKILDITTEDMKKELDKRRDVLNQQLDEQAAKIDEELKKFDFVKTVSDDLTKFRNSLFDKSCSHNDMLRVRADLEENKKKLTDLMSIGTTYQALNSVLFEKSVNQLKFAIQQFGELTEMNIPQLEKETTNINLDGETPMNYNKTWEVLAVDVAEGPPWGVTRGVTVNPHNGHIYATVGQGIVQYDLSAKVVKTYTTNDEPYGVTFDQKQRMIVTSLRDQNVKIYNCEGNKLLSQFGCVGTAPGQFDYPLDVVCDLDGRLYIADYRNSRIQVHNADGKFIYSIKENIDNPRFIHIDNNKTSGDWPRLFVSNSGKDKIIMFDVKGDNCTFVGEVAVQGPRGICQDKDGNILVVSYKDKVIHVLDKNGQHVSRISEPREALMDMDDITITDNGLICITSQYTRKIYFIHQPAVKIHRIKKRREVKKK